MMKADNNGNITGKFRIPPNTPVGTKLVEFEGHTGSSATATYTGSSQITINTLQQVTWYETTRAQTTIQRSDPLAQTFTLSSERHIGGVDLWFKKKGPEEVRVQIRETATGFPTQTVLAEGRLSSEKILTNGSATRVEFPPVFLNAGQEYAIVVLTDGAAHEVAISELGAYDSEHGWVTSQPYQVGVLLSSSNASSWTTHQSKDLAFRLLAATFADTEKTVPLGEFDVTEMTNFKPFTVVERPGSDTDLYLRMTDPNGTVYTMQEEDAVSLPDSLTGKVKVEAQLFGSALRSPVVYNNVQALTATLQQSADYISRAIPAGTDVKAIITFEALVAGQSGVDVFVEVNGAWQAVPLNSGLPTDAGWESRTYVLDGVTSPTIRAKLVLKGDPKNRPRARNLRVITTA